MSLKKKCWKPFNNYFRKKGNSYLFAVTILEVLFYILYTVVYCLRAQEQNQPLALSQLFKWFLTAVLLFSQIYFLWHSIVKKTLMELFSFLIMLFVTNTFFMIREINIVIQHSQDTHVTTLDQADYLLSWVGIVGASIAIMFVLLIFKPVFNNMYEDVFLKIGGNRNLWDVYRNLTLSKSFVKLDLINMVEFMITSVFIWFTVLKRDPDATHEKWNYIMLAPELFFFVLIILQNVHAHYLIDHKRHSQFLFTCFLRVFIEFFKLYKTAVTFLERDLSLQSYAPFIHDTQAEEDDFDNFRNALVGLEVLSFIVMVLGLHYIKKTIEVFGRTEFDLIRNNFTGDLYTRVQEISKDDYE